MRFLSSFLLVFFLFFTQTGYAKTCGDQRKMKSGEREYCDSNSSTTEIPKICPEGYYCPGRDGKFHCEGGGHWSKQGSSSNASCSIDLCKEKIKNTPECLPELNCGCANGKIDVCQKNTSYQKYGPLGGKDKPGSCHQLSCETSVAVSGQYCDSANRAIDCEVGYYCDPVKFARQKCSNGASSKPKSTLASDCFTTCSAKLGSYCDAKGVEQPCGDGKYCAGKDAQEKSCKLNEKINATKSGCEKCSAQPGSYCDAKGVEQPCGDGKYCAGKDAQGKSCKLNEKINATKSGCDSKTCAEKITDPKEICLDPVSTTVGPKTCREGISLPATLAGKPNCYEICGYILKNVAPYNDVKQGETS